MFSRLRSRRSFAPDGSTFIEAASLLRSQASRILVFGLAASVACLAQGVTLGLSSGSSSRGAPIALNISLNTTGSAMPVALQWTLNYSTLDFSSAAVTAGSGALTANKSITCNNHAGATTCLLWGLNATPISNGVLATIALIVSSSTTNTSSSVQLANGIAADAQGNAVTTSSSNGTVTIQQPTTSTFDVQPRTLGPLTANAGQGPNQNQTGSLDVTNNTLNPLQLFLSANVPWIKTSISSNPVPPGLKHGAITISIDATQLQASSNPYRGTLTVSSGSLSIPIQLTVQVSGIAIVASPNVINMSVTAGQKSQQQIKLLNASSLTPASSVGANFQATSKWLSVTSFDGTNFTVIVDATSLGIGSVSDLVNVVYSGAGSSFVTVPIPVNVTVNPPPTLSSNPSSLAFQVSAGSVSTSQAISVKTSDNVTPLSFSATPSDLSWIKLGQSNGTTPATLNVSIDATTLSVGPHNGTITLACAGTTSCPSVILSVSANVTGNTLSVNTSSLGFQVFQGRSNPQSQTVMISTTANTQLGFTVSGIPSWLQISPASGIASTTPSAVTITAIAGGLNPGTNSGNITLIPANSSAPATINVSATLLPFSIQVTPNPPTTVNLRPGQTQTISLSVGTADNGSADIQIATSTNSNANWLKTAANDLNMAT